MKPFVELINYTCPISVLDYFFFEESSLCWCPETSAIKSDVVT